MTAQDAHCRERPCDPAGPVILEKKVTFSALAAGLTSLVMAVSLIAGLSTRVEHLEARAGALDAEARGARGVAVAIARLEERMDSLHRSLEELKREMRRLSGDERGGRDIRDGGKERGGRP